MRRTRRRTLAALALPAAVAAIVSISGCTSASTASGTTQAAGSGSKGTLTLGMSQDIYGWDPANQPSYQNWAGMAVYDQLMICNAQGTPRPDIATSWALKPANLGVTLHLRAGMKFTDGSPVNAAAVKASLIYAAKNGAGALRLAGLTIATPNSSTVVITLAQPDPLLTARVLCSATIASPKFLASGQVNNSPDGSGPYTLDSAATIRGSVYTFTKNPSYWDAKAFPYSKLVLKVLTSDTAMMDALKTGQVEGALVSANDYNEAKASGLNVIEMHGETTRLLLTDHLGKVIPALGNVDVRRAINMVFNTNEMAADLYHGLAAPADQIFRPGSAASISGLSNPYPFNVAAAKALMAKAGYANGFSVQLPYLQGVGLDQLLPYVIQQLSLLNIKATQVTLSGPNAITELLSGKYPMLLWPLGNYADSRADIYDYVLPTGIWNVEHQHDATVAKLWNQILTGTAQQQAAAEQAINRYIIQQAWFVPMAYPDLLYAHSPSVSIPSVSDPDALDPQLWDFK